MSEKNKAVIQHFYDDVFAAGKVNIAAIDPYRGGLGIRSYDLGVTNLSCRTSC